MTGKVIKFPTAERNPECVMSQVLILAEPTSPPDLVEQAGQFLDASDDFSDSDELFLARCKVAGCEAGCALSPGSKETFIEAVRAGHITRIGICIEGYY